MGWQQTSLEAQLPCKQINHALLSCCITHTEAWTAARRGCAGCPGIPASFNQASMLLMLGSLTHRTYSVAAWNISEGHFLY